MGEGPCRVPDNRNGLRVRQARQQRRGALCQEDFERDRISGLTAAEQKGLKRGREEGLSEGRKQGRELGISQTKLENARNLLAMNVLTHEQIAQAVGLSVEKIDELAGIR